MAHQHCELGVIGGVGTIFFFLVDGDMLDPVLAEYVLQKSAIAQACALRDVVEDIHEKRLTYTTCPPVAEHAH
jgi:hypothetical protein